MSNWRYVKIGDVCTVERGGSPRPIDKFITEFSQYNTTDKILTTYLDIEEVEI